VLVQIFIALVPAWHYWTFLTDLASTSFGGFRKQPWLFVKLPTFGQSAEGKVSTISVIPRMSLFIFCVDRNSKETLREIVRMELLDCSVKNMFPQNIF